MLSDKVCHIVDDACDGYKSGFAGGTSGLEFVPREGRELGERKTPVKGCATGIEGFLMLLETAFFDLVVAESFEIVCEGGFREEED